MVSDAGMALRGEIHVGLGENQENKMARETRAIEGMVLMRGVEPPTY